MGLPKNLFDPHWLEKTRESLIDPARIIVDPHHHLWPRSDPPYPLDALIADITGGHDVRATVYMEALTHWRTSGPAHLRPVGETAFAAEAGEMAERVHGVRVAAAIVAHGQLDRGTAVQEALEAHVETGRGRFRGVRANLFWDTEVDLGIAMPARDLCESTAFREGFARLAPMGLSCDIMAFYRNLPQVARLAVDFPDTLIVLDHVGGPLGCPPYGDRQAEMFEAWRANLRVVAACPNVSMKFGGLAGSFHGPLIPQRLNERPAPPGSIELAELFRPYFEECLSAFGVGRIMFESNFPVDKHDYSYGILWNAFKYLAKDFSEAEKDHLFAGNAASFYRIALDRQPHTPS